MADFRFADPNWLYAMWPVAVVAALVFWLDWRRGDVLARFLSPAMQARLVHRMSRGRRWSSFVLLALAGVSLVVALMRPQWGLTYHQAPRVGAQIMFCLDVSKSMLAEDTAPNRLERAKAELTDLLSYLDGDQVGLIAFAGRAAVLCPLTPDFGFFKLILDGTGPHSVGRGGTRLEEPIRKALDGFRTESDLSRVLVLITDGEDHESHPLDAAKAATERGVKILAIGFGDEAGSEVFVTDPQTGARTQVRDADGRPVITRLDGDTLREMALATDGAYIPAGTGALDLKSIYEAHIAPLVRGQLDDRGHAVRRDAFQWAVLAGLAFLVASIIVGSGSVKSELRSWGAADEPHAASLDSPADEVTVKTNRGAPPRTAAAVGTALLVLTAKFAQPSSYAQEAQPAGETQAITADGVEQAAPDEKAKTEKPGVAKPADTRPVDPRDGYNEALAYLDTDFDRAERMLSEARRDAATDGDVRFRATYNLGWVEVKRADKLVGDQPQDALDHLRRSADWFRDAVRLRPDDSDARHNLDVVLRRILVLADSLAHKDERNLAQRLDELIEAQRRVVSGARQLVDRVAADTDPNAADGLRGEFRQLAVEQRKVLSDGQSVSRAAREELDALAAKKDEEKSPQDKLRAAQLTGLLDYASRAEQRLGQARGQMRRREASRSFRRAAAGLTELKRARDQLRGPVEVLDVILADAASLAQLTALKAQEAGLAAKVLPAPAQPASRAAQTRPTQAGDEADQTADASPAVESANTFPSLPWLTREYLEDDQTSLNERTGELTARLQAAAEQPSATTNQQGPQQADSTADAQELSSADRFLAMVREALPYLEKGQAAFRAASQALSADRLDPAAQSQLEAIAALRDARERFVDLRGLIELAYARQTEIQRVLPGPPSEKNGKADEKAAQADETAAGADTLELRMRLVAEIQSENIERGERLAKLIEAESAALPPPPADETAAATGSHPAGPAAQQASAQRQRLQLAGGLLQRARDEMSQVRALAARSPTDDREPADKAESAAKPGDSAETAPPAEELEQAASEARSHADRAVEHFQALRRLFFSITEHLRETAQRQAELNDETEQAAALSQSDDMAKKVGPLSHRQRELESIARQIATALHEQATQPPAGEEQQAADPHPDPKQLEQLKALAEQYTKAGKLVSEGQVEMEQAGEQLSEASTARDEPAEQHPQVDQARQHQNTALEKLVEALAVLEPPRPEQQQNQQDQKQENQKSDQSEGEQKKKPDQQSAGLDPSRLLQAVRDREAQRRRHDRDRRGRLQQEPVDKDW
jgi:Ca-activated chloride channel family protein